MPYRAGALTISNGCAKGEREDVSGRILAQTLEANGYAVTRRAVVSDEREKIAAILREWSEGACDLIVTTGGTGFAPRDITPEATHDVIERPAPGLAEMLRWAGFQKLPRAVLSRGAAGIRKRALIVNLPGSAGGVRDGMEALLPLLPHALALLRDEPVDHSPKPAASPATAPHGDSPPQTVTLLETNLDDLSPEMFETAMERLFTAGALDVFLSPLQMKKSRPATLLSVLCSPDKQEALAEIVFEETSAFGIRYTLMHRHTLTREWIAVETEYGTIRIKAGRWKGREVSAAPEYEEAKAAAQAHGVPVKRVYAAALAAYASRSERSSR